MNNQKVIIISGPTGTGKTKTAIELALKLNQEHKYKFEIINFDSVQFYKELDIGSAKPTIEELKLVPHHFIGIRSISEPMNASDFNKLAIQKVNELFKRNIIPIFVGGSGFYIRAFVKGMYESVSVSDQTRSMVNQILKDEGPIAIRKRLFEVDIESFERIHANDMYRSCRALEHWIETGTTFSNQSKKIDDPYNFSIQANPDINFLHFMADIPKEEHFPLLIKRTRQFFDNNDLLKEVEDLLKNGATGEEKGLQSIGYKETVEYLKDQSVFQNDINLLIDRIFISTRQLVKAQKTFFKKVQPKIIFNPLTDFQKVVERSSQFLESLNEK